MGLQGQWCIYKGGPLGTVVHLQGRASRDSGAYTWASRDSGVVHLHGRASRDSGAYTWASRDSGVVHIHGSLGTVVHLQGQCYN